MSRWAGRADSLCALCCTVLNCAVLTCSPCLSGVIPKLYKPLSFELIASCSALSSWCAFTREPCAVGVRGSVQHQHEEACEEARQHRLSDRRGHSHTDGLPPVLHLFERGGGSPSAKHRPNWRKRDVSQRFECTLTCSPVSL